MTQPTTTRRDLVRLGTSAAAYAAGAAIVTGGVALASEAKGATGISPALSRLIARHRAADDTINRFYAAVYNPAIDRQNAMLAAIPHVEVEVPALGDGSRLLRWSTAEPWTIGHPKSIARHPLEGQSQTPAWKARRREARSFYAAALRRERAVARTAITSGVEAASRQEDELWAPIKAARAAIHAFPVASLADLAAKLDFIEQDSGMDGDDLLPLVMADVARLSGGEA